MAHQQEEATKDRSQFSGSGAPWTSSYEDILASLDVSPDSGLDEGEIKQRQKEYGKNKLRQAEKRSAWAILVDQFKSLVVLLLVAAAIASFAFGEIIDGTAVLAVVLINAAIGFFTEMRAVRSMEALQEMGRVTTTVRRGGETKEVSAEELVPGDIVIIDGGDVITADLRLIEALKLQANESALTGESMPVAKQIEPLDDETPLAERANMVFKGTSVTRGAGEGVVVATGTETELGKISSLVDEAEDETTPLEKRLDEMGRKLIWLTLGVAALVAVVGIVRNRELYVMIETSIALAVAAIPEGLPIVATITLARGMRRMARRNALINQLAGVETLGGTNIICTDKTGTLTENQMTVTHLVLASGDVEISGEGLEREGEFELEGEKIDPAEHKALRRALETGVLCSNASLSNQDENGAVGEPIEVALLVAGVKAGLKRDDLLEEQPETREETFDPDTKMMATFHQTENGFRVAVKGAPEAVLPNCNQILTGEGDGSLEKFSDSDREKWEERNQALAEKGLRLLALAEKNVDSDEADPYQDLTFIGLVGLLDPPREEVRDAINACQDAGIRVVMVTGDQQLTAKQVGQAVGLFSNGTEAAVLDGRELKGIDELSQEEQDRIRQAHILARVTPEQKLSLIEIHQHGGAVVAMTGDGVNDAPALKKADIGVAMGQRGTQVAKDAADMVLQDDAFSTIVVAIEQGRIIFKNIRKFIVYHLSGNISQIIAVGCASLVGAPLPLLPLQILFLNIGIDVFPALALGAGEKYSGIMSQPPRDPKEPIMTRRHWYIMGGYGLLLAVTVLAALALALLWLGVETQQAVTISFLTLALAKLWHVFNMREEDTSLIDNDVTRNPYVWLALGVCLVLILLAVYLPGLADILKVVNPGWEGWTLAAAVSLTPLVVGQALKFTGLTKI